MTAWPELENELAAWAAAGRVATLWWRDDDAHAAGPALDRLLALARRAGVPVAVATIPALIEEGAAAALREAGVDVLQHGYSHRNHAPESSKKAELAEHRPPAEVSGELAEGWRRLNAALGRAPLPVLVPPWNRIGESVIRILPALGYRGLSRMGVRARPAPAPGLSEINAHVDIVDWKAPIGPEAERAPPMRKPRPFIGVEALASALAASLRARRQDAAEAAEPIGLLTHHLVHGDDAWAAVGELMDRSHSHPAVRWASARELFGQ